MAGAPAGEGEGAARALTPRGGAQGNISNMITFVFMAAGLALRVVFKDDWREESMAYGRYILAFGLFGFAGGVTNWLAVKMLFDEIPGVYGSGIIPKQFKEIRRTMKVMIMDTFFEPQFLQKQFADKIEQFADKDVVIKRMNQMFNSAEFDKMLDDRLARFTEVDPTNPMGMMMGMMGATAEKLKPTIKNFVGNMSGDIAPIIAKLVGRMTFPIDKIREQVDVLMEDRLKELTADRVKKLIEAVMRAHLGWLVVWGNIFGGLIGVVSEAAGY